MGLTKYKLGELIKQRREKYDGISNLPIRGVSCDGFINAKQPNADISLYNVYYLYDFVFNPARMEINSIALNTKIDRAICSSLYEIFYVKDTNVVLPQYLNLFIKRSEFARMCEFIGWGSAREYCRVEDISDIDIYLPSIDIQKKYVNIYNAMVANQQSYERGLEDLKLSIDASIEKFKHNEKRIPLGEMIEESDIRNIDGDILVVHGVNKDKEFMPSVASGADLSRYKIVRKGQFACNLMHVGRDVAVPIALHKEDKSIIVSPAYFVFNLIDASVLPEYAMIWLSRNETDRYAWFLSDTNVRSGMEKKRFCEIEIPIPDIQQQKALVEMYNVYIKRRSINEKLKQQVKKLCPILIKGSLEEGHRMEIE